MHPTTMQMECLVGIIAIILTVNTLLHLLDHLYWRKQSHLKDENDSLKLHLNNCKDYLKRLQEKLGDKRYKDILFPPLKFKIGKNGKPKKMK